MRLFEQSWSIKDKTYVREYDTDKKTSIMREVPYKSEYYIEDILGKYKSFLDQSVSLRRVQGGGFNNPGAYGITKAEYVTIREDHFGKNTYNKTPGIFYLDIETSVSTQPGSTGFPQPEEALEPIVLIQFFDTTSNKGYVLGLEEWTYKSDYSYDFDVEYICCDSEQHLIHNYLDLFKKLNPFTIYAWNGNGFDYPYMFNRMKRLKISTDMLSNFGKVNLKTKKNKEHKITYELESIGHIYFDMMDVYKKFVMDPVASYSLDFIGEKETGISKVEHDNYLKFDHFRLGKYVVLGNESEEQKDKKIHKCAVALETLKDPDKRFLLEKYIKEKSYSEFVHYGIMDFVILKGIDKSRNFTSLITHMSEMMGCQLQDTLGTLKAWNAYISNKVLQKGLILPPKVDNNLPNIVGGYVKDPIRGKHKWVLSVDVSSMYPLLSMASFNMSAETFIPISERHPEITEIINKYFYDQDEDKLLDYIEETWEKIAKVLQKHKVSIGINGAAFHQNFQGIIPELVLEIYQARKTKKKQMIEVDKEIINTSGDKKLELEILSQLLFTSQLTDKLSINSLYGALGQRYFPLFNESIAAAITGNGRFFIKLLANNIEDKLQSMISNKSSYVIYNDTDSCYFSIDPFIEKYCSNKSILEKTEFADRFYKKVIEEVVQETIKTFSFYLNAYDPKHIGADREIIADSALFVAKKKYTARVRDEEGKRYPEDKPYLKVMGLEISQGGTAVFAKKYLKEAIPVILDKSTTELKDWFSEVRNKYAEEHLYSIAKTIGVSKLKDPNWGKIIGGRRVSIPFGSKTCIASNKYIIDNNLEEEYPLIEPGSKVKVLYLSKPNPLGNTEAFAFESGKFADLFKDYIDRDKTFDKFFVSPLENMVKALNIDLSKNLNDLDEW